ncbi:DUF5694 domain-containing protein [Fodinibius saliphilus]|uniref:DUF5694 domain-containing protein n=1 Tax=Fodinibius saliphilus TaxID=1920650 RepID=UPI001109B306|nr:DUF5694 domain-containing protein [Fodinibius saliphilus]
MKHFKKSLFFAGLLLWTILPITLKAQLGNVTQNAKEKPKLVILGTYHMATTTSNVINTDVDDVTTPERQREILELMDKLKKFKPTKIALECDYEVNDKAQKQYKDYLAGDFELTRNEVHQIGFRLGKELGHKKIYCIDWGIFPDDPLYNYETYSRQHPDLNQYLNELYKNNEEKATRAAERIASRSIVDNLIAINHPDSIEKDHQEYFKFLRIGKGDEYVGANYLSWWYSRNLKILMNIIRFTESSEDHILVVYGSGHNKLLNQLAKESAFYEVESPLKYLRD